MSADEFCELCLTGTPEEIEAAIRDGADVNALDKYNLTPLGMVVGRRIKFNPEFCPEIVSILLKAGADAHTMLMHAALENNDPEIFSLLLKAGADVNVKNNDGVTVLMFAAMFNSYSEVVSSLIEAGADVNAKNKYGFTALMFAARANPNPEVVSVLLKAGADTDAKDIDGQRAIDYAEENEALKGTAAYKMLLEASK
jgi:ankyrin repeat protein